LVALDDFPEGWEETAALFMPTEVIFPENWEELLCLILHGYAVEVGRSGHAIPYTFWNHAEQAMGYADSYNVVRYDSLRTVKAAANGSFAVAAVKQPANWLDPAGTLAT
jgi:hypothetical protein